MIFLKVLAEVYGSRFWAAYCFGSAALFFRTGDRIDGYFGCLFLAWGAYVSLGFLSATITIHNHIHAGDE